MQNDITIPARRNISIKYSNKFQYIAVLFNRIKLTFATLLHMEMTYFCDANDMHR